MEGASAGLVGLSACASAQVGRGDDMTVDHVRSEFISAGLHADIPTQWWTTDGVATFRAADPTSDPDLISIIDGGIANL